MRASGTDRWLKAGWIIVFISAIAFMIFSIFDASTPLLGEEQFAGTTYANLQTTSPKIANIIWHDTVLFGLSLFTIFAVVAILSWRELSKGSRLAWYLLVFWGPGYLVAALVAHVPIGDTSPSHTALPTALLIVYFIGLLVSGKAILSETSGVAALL